MEILGEMLLDGQYLPTNPVDGKLWLERAAHIDSISAMLILGSRLLDGRGLSRSQAQGLKWLRKAANQGNAIAMTALARRYAVGDGLQENRNRAHQWIQKAKQIIDKTNNWDEKRGLGVALYLIGDYQSAATLFLQGYQNDQEPFRINLAYMIRRQEIPADIIVPPITDLLSQLLSEKKPEAIVLINYALCLATGFAYPQDWHKADETIANLEDVDDDWEWWYDLTKRGDSEGELVVGWLVRHHHIKDPDGLTVAERLQRAADARWDIPEWMFESN